MSLSLEEITALSRRVASAIDPRFTVVGVSSNHGEAERVELLITVEGCHQEPCQLLVNVPRTERAALERTLQSELTNVFRQHADDSRS